MHDEIARFLDTHVVRTNPFGRNTSGEKAYRRAERIVGAIHLISNHVPQGEPVREMARAVALRLLSDILLLRDGMRISGSTRIRRAHATLRHLISLVRTFTIAGYVSLQNAEVIVEALDDLGNFLNVSQRSGFADRITISKDDLMPVEGQIVHSDRSASVGLKSISDIKDRSISDSVTVKDKSGVQLKGESGEQFSPRARAVLDVLRLGGQFGIRDIASNLPEYSEKMIQRELVDLAAKSRVVKTGRKRWSKYSLA